MPDLRGSSFSGADETESGSDGEMESFRAFFEDYRDDDMEEFAEAMAFMLWLHDSDASDDEWLLDLTYVDIGILVKVFLITEQILILYEPSEFRFWFWLR